MLRENQIETEDVLLQLGVNGVNDWTFFDLAWVEMRRDLIENDFYFNPNILYSAQIFLDDIIIEHSRSIYGIIDFLGDIGGILEILSMFVHFFIFNYAVHKFIQTAARKIFQVQTKKHHHFKNKSLKRQNSVKFSIKQSDSIKLFFVRNFCCCKCLSNDRLEKYNMVLEKANDELEKSLDVLNIHRHKRKVDNVIDSF